MGDKWVLPSIETALAKVLALERGGGPPPTPIRRYGTLAPLARLPMSHSSPGPHRRADMRRMGRRAMKHQRRHRAAWSDQIALAVALMGRLSGMILAFAAGLVAARWLRGGDPTWAVLARAFGILACLPLMRR